MSDQPRPPLKSVPLSSSKTGSGKKSESSSADERAERKADIRRVPLTAAVDPGQIITIKVALGGDPDKVEFRYQAPGSDRVVVGGSKRISKGVYESTIDTLHMHGGNGWWYFVGEGGFQRAKLGRFFVREAPNALVGNRPIKEGAKQSWLERPVLGPVPGWGVIGFGCCVALAAISFFKREAVGKDILRMPQISDRTSLLETSQEQGRGNADVFKATL